MAGAARADRWPVFVLFVAGLLTLLREDVTPAWDSLWAEDAHEFLSGALSGKRVLDPYLGYFHPVPRLIAALVATADPALWPWLLSLLAAILAIVCGVFVYYASVDVIEPRTLRAALAVWIVLPPVAPEIIANVTNVHWYLLAAAFWAFWAPESLNRWAIAVGAAAALSNPLTSVYAAIGVIRRKWLLTSVVAAGSLAHLLASGDGLGITFSNRGVAYWMRSVWAAYGGDPLSMAMVASWPLLTVVPLVGLMLLSRRTNPVFLWSVIGTSIALAVLPAILRGGSGDISYTYGNVRYVFVPAFLLLSLLLASLAKRLDARILAVALVIILVSAFTIDTRSAAPAWSETTCGETRGVAPDATRWYISCDLMFRPERLPGHAT